MYVPNIWYGRYYSYCATPQSWMLTIALQSHFATAQRAHESMLSTSTLWQQGLDLDLRRVSFIDVKTASHSHAINIQLSWSCCRDSRYNTHRSRAGSAARCHCNLVHCNAITVCHLLLLQHGLGCLSLRCWQVSFISTSRYRYGITHHHRALLLRGDSRIELIHNVQEVCSTARDWRATTLMRQCLGPSSMCCALEMIDNKGNHHQGTRGVMVMYHSREGETRESG